MSALPPPTILAANAGVYNNSGTDKSELLLIYDFATFAFSGITVTFSIDYKRHADIAWTTVTTLSLSKLITGLNNSDNYDYRIKATAAGYDDSSYVTGTVSTGAPTGTASAIVAHQNLTAINVSLTGAGDAQVSWLPQGNQYTRTRVSFSATGFSTVTQDTSDLVQSIVIHGLVVGVTYTCTVTPIAVLNAGTTVSSHPITTTVTIGILAPFWTGPDKLYLEVGIFAAAGWQIWATGNVLDTQSKFSAPGANLAFPDPAPVSFFHAIFVAGIPTNEGIVRGLVTGVVQDSLGNIIPVTKDVTIGITGAICVGWFNDDPSHTDLQIIRRTRAVQSFAASDSNNGVVALRLTRGDTRRIHIFERDAAGRVSGPTLTAYHFIVRPKNRRAGRALIEVKVSSPTTSTFNGNVVPYFDVTPKGAVLDRIFGERNTSPGGDAAEGTIECEGELAIFPSVGNPYTSQPFPVFIAQDLDR